MSILGPIFNMLLKCDKVMHGEQNLILSLSIIRFIPICAAVNHPSQEGTTSVSHNSLSVCALPSHIPKAYLPVRPRGNTTSPHSRRQKEQRNLSALPVSMLTRTHAGFQAPSVTQGPVTHFTIHASRLP